ncbi:MAG: hypothetical protein KBF33_14805 [Comamonas sp.]|nr:hypothetical protein [Comamonas sp.]
MRLFEHFFSHLCNLFQVSLGRSAALKQFWQNFAEKKSATGQAGKERRLSAQQSFTLGTFIENIGMLDCVPVFFMAAQRLGCLPALL